MAERNLGPNIKRIKPYPFKASLEKDAAKITVEIIHIEGAGFIARMGEQFVHVGEIFQAVFELPALHEFVNTPVRVLKTYDKATDTVGRKVERLAEFHFQKLLDDHKARISSFMTATGQAKKEPPRR